MPTYTSILGFDATNGQADALNATDIVTVAGGIIDTPIGQSGTAQAGGFAALSTTGLATLATAAVTSLAADQVAFSTDAAGTITGNNNLQWNGTTLAITGALTGTTTADFGTSVTVGAANDMVISVGLITSASGAISFDNENLTTTGNFSAKDGDFSGNLTVVGDIISGGATDVIIKDKFIDLAFVDTASGTVANAGGFTVSQNRLSGFTAGQVATFNTQAGSGASFTYSGNGDVQGTALADGDVIAITGSEEGGNDGLFIVDTVSGTINVGVGQTAVIRSLNSTAGVPPGACPWAQNNFASATTQTGVAMKVDLSVVCIADGSANFKTSGGASIAKGSFITSTNGTETTVLGSVVGNWTANGAYAQVEADVDLQDAYALGNTITTSTANGSVAIISTIDDTSDVMTITAGNHTASTAGELLTLTTHANSAGDCLQINNLGSGNALNVQDGGVTALAVDAAGAVDITPTSGQALTLTAAGAGTMDITSGAGAMTLTSAAGGTAIESSAGAIDIGATNVSQAINIGNHASSDRQIGIGAGSTTDVNIDGGGINLGTEPAAATVVTIGEATNANNFSVDSGTGTIAMNGAGTIGIGTDADAGTLSVGTGGARAIAVGSAAALSATVDAVTLSVDSTTSSNLTMTANADAVHTLTIKALNPNAGASAAGHLSMQATTDATLQALEGAVLLVQGQLVAKAGGVDIGRVLGVTTGALTVEHVTSATLTSFQLYGIATATTAAGDAVAAHCFPGTITEMDVVSGDPCLIGDVLYLTTSGEVTPVIPAAANTIFRVGVALTAGDGLQTAVYSPQYIMTRN